MKIQIVDRSDMLSEPVRMQIEQMTRKSLRRARHQLRAVLVTCADSLGPDRPTRLMLRAESYDGLVILAEARGKTLRHGLSQSLDTLKRQVARRGNRLKSRRRWSPSPLRMALRGLLIANRW
ncbi:MAG: hypothetical protein ACE366_19875 [Bradymonadia bacterium]